MPKIYEYMGIIIFFYSNEHEPIHVHGKHNGKETKAEIHLFNGVIKEIILKDKGAGLEPKKRKQFEDVVNHNAQDIVDKWVDYFVKKKPVIPRIITQKVSRVSAIN